MKSSSFVITETLKEKLLEFPNIVEKLQDKDPIFIQILEIWIKEIEVIFKRNNISEVSEMAGLWSKILAPLFSESTRVIAKKKQIHVAAELLYDVQSTVLGVLHPHERKVNESREIIKQLLNILQHTNVIKFNNGEVFQNFINKIWDIFIINEQLKPSILKVLLMISQPDAQRIIAEEINIVDWQN